MNRPSDSILRKGSAYDINITYLFFAYSFLVIGYGLTSTGFTVLAGILMATLGMTYVAGGARYKRRQKKRKFGVFDKRQEFVENCNINPHLKPACIRNVQNLQKRRKYIPRSWFLFFCVHFLFSCKHSKLSATFHFSDWELCNGNYRRP